MRTRVVPLFILVLATLAVLGPVFAHAIEVWQVTEEFSFGFLIVPVSVAILVVRRKALLSSLGPGSVKGLLLVGPALGAYVLGQRLGINPITALAVIPLLLGMAAYLWGWRTARLLSFPVGFLIFGLGLHRGLLNSVGFTLQGATAIGAAAMVQTLGLPVVRDGLVLRSDRFSFVVAEACSGMSSLLSLLALASLLIYAARGSIHARAAVVLSVLPLVTLANTTRVALVMLVAQWLGQDAALGFFHGASSLILFGLSLVGLLAVARIVGCRSLVFAPSY